MERDDTRGLMGRNTGDRRIRRRHEESIVGNMFAPRPGRNPRFDELPYDPCPSCSYKAKSEALESYLRESEAELLFDWMRRNAPQQLSYYLYRARRENMNAAVDTANCLNGDSNWPEIHVDNPVETVEKE